MLKSDKVQSSDKGKNKLRKAYSNAALTQEKLAKQANVSVDTVKRLLGTKPCPNGVERWAVENIATVLDIKPTDIVDPNVWFPQRQLPLEFKRLIQERTQLFCGRKFVFDSIENFLKDNTNGYFTIIGEPGVGKTAIAAKYVLDNPEAICFFNIRAEGMNRPELFLNKIRQQLMNRYQLLDVENDNLSTLLTKVSEQISAGERLIIVIDALDEVEQAESSGNILHLPTILPKQVYFLLTRRPCSDEEKKLIVSLSTPSKVLNFKKISQQSNEDVKEYIEESLKNDKYRDGLNKWIQKQKDLSNDGFVQQIIVKSENNFMYLR